MHKLATLTLALLLSSCASYSGRGLVVSDSSYDEVIRVMGRLALEWTDAAGSRQLAYPRGPMGVHTYTMLAAILDGRFGFIEQFDKVLCQIRCVLISDFERRSAT